MTEARSAWENFDRLAKELADRKSAPGYTKAMAEKDFAWFLSQTKEDFWRLARKVARDKKIPASWSEDDVFQEVVTAAWHNFYVRVGGFDPAKYRSPGAWMTWKAKNRARKNISRAKGEDQHKRQGPGRPEYLSKEGVLPEAPADSMVEERVEASLRLDRLEKVCATAREFAVLHAIARELGDRESVIVSLAAGEGFAGEADARAELKKFEKNYLTKKVPRRRVSAAA